MLYSGSFLCSCRVFVVVKPLWRNCSRSTRRSMCCSTAPTHSIDSNWITASWLVRYASEGWIYTFVFLIVVELFYLQLLSGLALSRKDFYCCPNKIRDNNDGPDVQVSAVMDLSFIIKFCFAVLETNVNNIKTALSLGEIAIVTVVHRSLLLI